MKRALLIAGGTVGGLGAVLSITPPQLGSQGMANLSSSVNGAASTSTAHAASSQTAKAVVPQATSGVVSASASSATPKATVKKKRTTSQATVATKKTTAAATKKVASAAPTPTPTPTANTVNGTFAGSSVFVNYGTVQVEITVVNGKITDAHALQAPTGRSDRFTQYAVPRLREQTLAAQSANIQGVTGASYTSYGWYTSLQEALAKAGL